MNRKQRRTFAKSSPASQRTASSFAFAQALEHYRAGRLAEAETLCLEMGRRGRLDAPALRILGGIAISRRDGPAAVDHLSRAAEMAPDDALAWTDLGVALRMSGQMADSAQASRRALALDADNALAHDSLGVALKYLGQLDEAEAECRTAVRLNPVFAEAWSDLGNVLADLGRMDEAIDCHRKALTINPARLEARGNLGIALAVAGRLDEAETELRLVMARNPADPRAHNNLGGVLEELGRHDDAERECRRALDIQPVYPEAWSNRGNALTSLGRLGEAVECFNKAVAQRPDYVDAHVNRGRALQAMRRPVEAAQACRSAIALNPGSAEAHTNLGMALLLAGDMTEGWAEYEWRWHVRANPPKRPQFSQPRWDGQPLAGRTLLLHAEQGYGDQLQFCRYATGAAKLGARVVLAVSDPLVRLLSTLDGVAEVVATDGPLPSFDFHQTLMSLPRVMGTTLDNVPPDNPYLFADPVQAAAWKDRLQALPGLKVGLVWAGEPHVEQRRVHAVDRRRSIAPDLLVPPLSVPGVSLVSLQMGQAAGHVQALPEARRPLNVMDGVQDFADTAAIIANLDLVISVDTSVVHLAGALGKPVWVLSRYDGCWRWLLDRTDSPWYPTLRLFRQNAPGAWDAVVADVARALALEAARI